MCDPYVSSKKQIWVWVTYLPKPGMMAHTFDPSTRKAEEGRV